MPWKKILCPIDFSAGADEALRTAVRMAKEAGAELVLAHVWQPPVYTFGEGIPVAGDLVSDLIRDAERSLAKRQAELAADGVNVTTRFLQGVPWNEIVEAAARERDIDLIVMGTHGRTGLGHVLLGSVAEKVVRHSTTPVLVVRTRA